MPRVVPKTPDLIAILRAQGGIAAASELPADPAIRRAFTRAVAHGHIARPRHGVYAVPDAHPAIVRASAIGGRLTGVSALAHHGLWCPPPGAVAQMLRVEVDARTRVRHDLAERSGANLTWVRGPLVPRFGFAPLHSVLAHSAHELTVPYAVAVLDSAVRCTALSTVDLQMLAEGWSSRARIALTLVDERAESGTESILRVLLHEAGIPARPQPPVPIGGFERADLLVGDRLLIECDSEAHHAEPKNRRADLKRDEILFALGYIVVRLDYAQVLGDPEGVVATIAAMVARGEHRWHGSVARSAHPS